MNDDDIRQSTSLARGIRVAWVILWALTTILVALQIRDRHPDEPLVTGDFLALWLWLSISLGVQASIAGWFAASSQQTPFQTTKLSILFSVFGQLVYTLVVVCYYLGMMLAMLLALEAIIQRFDSLTITSLLEEGISPFPVSAFPYLALIFLIIVAIAQSFVVDRPMARWILSKLDALRND